MATGGTEGLGAESDIGDDMISAGPSLADDIANISKNFRLKTAKR